MDGVICGHVHTPQNRKIDGIAYFNDGDWVESCSALVEHFDGTFELISWPQGLHPNATRTTGQDVRPEHLSLEQRLISAD